MNKSENIGNLATALSKAQGELKPASKDATNPFLKNKFADLGSVIEAVRATLAKYELSFVQIPVTSGDTVGVETILMHSSGEWLGDAVYLPLDDEKGISRSQVAGKVITYLRRYALSAVLGVYADEDTDGNGTGKAPPQRAPQTAQNKPTAAPPATRENALHKLKAVRLQEKELLTRRNQSQDPIALSKIESMTDNELDELIKRTESNVMDLRAALQTANAGR